MSNKATLVWLGFLYNSDKEDIIQAIAKIHTDVNASEGLAAASIDEETGRERAAVFCKGRQASRGFVTFTNANMLWKFLGANK